MEPQHNVLRGVGSGYLSNRSALARHEASFFFIFFYFFIFIFLLFFICCAGWLVWAIKTGDFCLARCHSSQGSNPALHWAAGARGTCLDLFPHLDPCLIKNFFVHASLCNKRTYQWIGYVCIFYEAFFSLFIQFISVGLNIEYQANIHSQNLPEYVDFLALANSLL